MIHVDSCQRSSVIKYRILVVHVAVVKTSEDIFAWSIDGFSQEKIGENQPKVLHVQSMFPIRCHRTVSLFRSNLDLIPRRKLAKINLKFCTFKVCSPFAVIERYPSFAVISTSFP